ncbi:structural glycoprotein p40 [Malacosoma neustria nucleopolyhedrovirus]|uniref:structural glycoprotein p40 n=1 Tax=Malacosoma neustria nuclear polyhedrosis virus TaxID=38012 RepID=UPI000E35E6DF|nr:structural glycoprotein p40 [Malacosoma neustria nucleopolyhedrovirus]AUF81589.1 structural glycoprotein p40 [Malacosoma neustria nucleopolyhedrovirus]
MALRNNSYIGQPSMAMINYQHQQQHQQQQHPQQHYVSNHQQNQQQHYSPNQHHYALATTTTTSASPAPSVTSSTGDLWMNKCVDYIGKIIKYYRTNDMSQLTPQMISLVNTIRDVCIESNPVHVNITKRFDSDENLIKYYSRLQKELGGNVINSEVFQPSFIYSVLPSYAQKFYNNGGENVNVTSVSEAAKQLSLAFQYQIAEAMTNNIPIPLPFNQQLANNYMTLLLQRATIPTNIQNAVNSRKYPQLNMINDLINSVIEDIFVGGSDYYNYMLNEKIRSKIVSLKENISFLTPSLSASTDIFQYVADLATRAGKKPSLFQSATFLTASPSSSAESRIVKTSCQQSLTELAFQNEALRRLIFQQLSYKHNNQLSTPTTKSTSLSS